MNNQEIKKSIIKGTKEGELYLDIQELFEQKDIKELVEKLYNSNIRRRIQNHRLAQSQG